MPVEYKENDAGDTVPYYHWPYNVVAITPTRADVEHLLNTRRAAHRLQEEFADFQKLCGRDDPAGAKFFKQEARRQLRIVRAVGFILPYFDAGEAVEPNKWPIELADELDTVSYQLAF